MSQGQYSHTQRAVGQVLTAAIYNADHQSHITNQNPAMSGGYSDTVAEMQLMTDPGGVGSESLAATLAGELERIRFQIDRIIGGTHWYEAPPSNLGSVALPSGTVRCTISTSLEAGWLWCNGLTIGNASSGGTARANADTESLFTKLWNSMGNTQAPVLPSGRGASAAADFAANKTIQLPDICGRTIAGQDDMGGVASKNRLTGQTGGVNADTMGATGGEETHDLILAETPGHTHGGGSLVAADHRHPLFANETAFNTTELVSGSVQVPKRTDIGVGASDIRQVQTATEATVGRTGPVIGTLTLSGATASAGGGDSHNNVPPIIILNWVINY